MSRDAWARYAPGAPAAVRRRDAGLQVQHDGHPGGARHPSARAASSGSCYAGRRSGAATRPGSRRFRCRCPRRPLPATRHARHLFTRPRRSRGRATCPVTTLQRALQSRGIGDEHPFQGAAPALVLRGALPAETGHVPQRGVRLRPDAVASPVAPALTDADVDRVIDALTASVASPHVRSGASAPIRALFSVAAGPRIGFGHLVRARVLSRALRIVRPLVSLRGLAAVGPRAERLGMRPVSGSATALLARLRPDVLVIDDPSAAAARAWCRGGASRADPGRERARPRHGVLWCGPRDRRQHRAAARRPWPRRRRRAPARAACATRCSMRRCARRRPVRSSASPVLIALGGGPRRSVARRLAQALRDASPGLAIRVAGGFAEAEAGERQGITWLAPQPGLARELSRCSVAITGGGVSLYEAVTLGTPVVAWPVGQGTGAHGRSLPAPRPGGGRHAGPGRVRRAVHAVLRAIDASGRKTPAPRAAGFDGRGAARVAAAIARARRPCPGSRCVIGQPRAVLFDLDETLYAERRFALSGFAAVARATAADAGVTADRIFRLLAGALRRGQRATAFQQLCASLGWPSSRVAALVGIYRSHAPSLRLPVPSRHALDALRAGWRLAIVTNGPIPIQTAQDRARSGWPAASTRSSTRRRTETEKGSRSPRRSWPPRDSSALRRSAACSSATTRCATSRERGGLA